MFGVRVWDTNKKGAVPELAIQLAAERLDIGIYKPVSEHRRADLVLEIGERLFRVQCKWGRLSEPGDVIFVRNATSRSSPRGYIRTTYDGSEVDLFAVYCGQLDRCFLIPVGLVAGQSQLQLRLMPTRNNQRACITLAEDFAFEGAVAQLARASGWQPEGRGFESPQLHSSEADGDDPATIGSELFGKQVGYWMQRAARGEEITGRHIPGPASRATRSDHPIAALGGIGVPSGRHPPTTTVWLTSCRLAATLSLRLR
jgi:hypothetical protein